MMETMRMNNDNPANIVIFRKLLRPGYYGYST